MNTNNDFDKSIMLVNFSILGIEGFKTVCAHTANPGKRMLSVINRLDRECKRIADILEKTIEDTNRLSIAGAAERVHAQQARKSADIIREIRDQIGVQTDDTVLQVTDATKLITTEEFLAMEDTFFLGNQKLFLGSAVEMHAALKAHIAKRIANRPITTDLSDHTPLLYMCTGGMFGDKPFMFFLTPDIIEKCSRDGEPFDLIRNNCYRQLNSIKSFQLTDFLRLTGDSKEKIKSNILKIDKYIDTLGEINIVDCGPVISKMFLGDRAPNTPAVKSRKEIFKKTSTILITENELRLSDCVMDLFSDVKA